MLGAEKLLLDMEAAEILPTAATYCTLIRGYGRAHELDRVLETMSRMDRDLGPEPRDAYVLASCVDALVSCGELGEARRRVSSAEVQATHLLSPHVYGSIIKGLRQVSKETYNSKENYNSK